MKSAYQAGIYMSALLVTSGVAAPVLVPTVRIEWNSDQKILQSTIYNGTDRTIELISSTGDTFNGLHFSKKTPIKLQNSISDATIRPVLNQMHAIDMEPKEIIRQLEPKQSIMTQITLAEAWKNKTCKVGPLVYQSRDIRTALAQVTLEWRFIGEVNSRSIVDSNQIELKEKK